jgi:hypothetical protein
MNAPEKAALVFAAMITGCGLFLIIEGLVLLLLIYLGKI